MKQATEEFMARKNSTAAMSRESPTSGSDGMSKMDCSDEELPPSDAENDDELLGCSLDASLPWPWGKENDIAVCQTCTANFLNVPELVRHYMSTPCGNQFRPEKRARSPVTRIVIRTATPNRGSINDDYTYSSGDMPPGGREEIRALVRDFLARNGVDSDSSPEEMEEEIEDNNEDQKRVLKVVVDKITSPLKSPKVKNSPLAAKLKNGGEMPKKKKFKANRASPLMMEHGPHKNAIEGPDYVNEPMEDYDVIEDNQIEEVRYKPSNCPRSVSQVKPLIPKRLPVNNKVTKPKSASSKFKKCSIKNRPFAASEASQIAELVQAAERVEKRSAKSPRPNKQFTKILSDSATAAPIPEQTGDILCEHCDYHAEKMDQLQHHYFSEHGTNLCPHCKMQIDDAKIFAAHLEKHIVYQCPKCDRFMASKPAFLSHLRSHKIAMFYICDECKAQFKTRNALATHMEDKHSMDRRGYICEHCDASYGTLIQIENHKRKQHRRREMHCTVCNMTCYSNYDMDKHVFETHILTYEHSAVRGGEGKYQCKVCSLRMTNGRKMRNHVNVHKYKEEEVKPEIKSESSSDSIPQD